MSTEESKPADISDDKRQSLGNSKSRYADNILPMARIKKIMKMDPNITDNISVEATYLICTATEFFVRWLSKEAYNVDKTHQLSYKTLAEYVQSEEKLDFLHQIIPHKITVKEYKKILSEENDKVFDSGTEASTSSSSEESDEEESGEEEESENEK